MTKDTTAKQSTAKAPAPITEIPISLNVALERMNREFCIVSRLPGIAVIPTPDDPEIHIYSRGEFCQTVCSNRRVDTESLGIALSFEDRSPTRCAQ